MLLLFLLFSCIRIQETSAHMLRDQSTVVCVHMWGMCICAYRCVCVSVCVYVWYVCVGVVRVYMVYVCEPERVGLRCWSQRNAYSLCYTDREAMYAYTVRAGARTLVSLRMFGKQHKKINTDTTHRHRHTHTHTT